MKKQVCSKLPAGYGKEKNLGLREDSCLPCLAMQALTEEGLDSLSSFLCATWSWIRAQRSGLDIRCCNL